MKNMEMWQIMSVVLLGGIFVLEIVQTVLMIGM
jgi:hypothetical protein